MSKNILVRLLEADRSPKDSKFLAFCNQSQKTWKNPTQSNINLRAKLLYDPNGVKHFIRKNMWTSALSKFADTHLDSIRLDLNRCYQGEVDPKDLTTMKRCQVSIINENPVFTELLPILNAGCTLYDISEVLGSYRTEKSSGVSQYISN